MSPAVLRKEAATSRSLPAVKQLIKTTCPYCGVGCGIDIEVDVNTGINTDTDTTEGLDTRTNTSRNPDPSNPSRVLTKLSGTPEHPANFGRLCVKGSGNKYQKWTFIAA